MKYLVGIVFLLMVLTYHLNSQSNLKAQAQDTAPAWEYAALAYDGDTAFAFTGDLLANNEINKIYDAMEPDSMNSISVMNVLGARGWEYIDYQPGTPVVYMFRRPLE
jgi:hypothetical protein